MSLYEMNDDARVICLGRGNQYYHWDVLLNTVSCYEAKPRLTYFVQLSFYD